MAIYVRGVYSVRQNDCNYAIFWFIPRTSAFRGEGPFASADHNGLVGGSSPAKPTTQSHRSMNFLETRE
jgi:hypothetical protein